MRLFFPVVVGTMAQATSSRHGRLTIVERQGKVKDYDDPPKRSGVDVCSVRNKGDTCMLVYFEFSGAEGFESWNRLKAWEGSCLIFRSTNTTHNMYKLYAKDIETYLQRRLATATYVLFMGSSLGGNAALFFSAPYPNSVCLALSPLVLPLYYNVFSRNLNTTVEIPLDHVVPRGVWYVLVSGSECDAWNPIMVFGDVLAAGTLMNRERIHVIPNLAQRTHQLLRILRTRVVLPEMKKQMASLLDPIAGPDLLRNILVFKEPTAGEYHGPIFSFKTVADAWHMQSHQLEALNASEGVEMVFIPNRRSRDILILLTDDTTFPYVRSVTDLCVSVLYVRNAPLTDTSRIEEFLQRHLDQHQGRRVNTTFVGEHVGGNIAFVLAHRFGAKAICFNPYSHPFGDHMDLSDLRDIPDNQKSRYTIVTLVQPALHGTPDGVFALHAGYMQGLPHVRIHAIDHPYGSILPRLNFASLKDNLEAEKPIRVYT